MSIHAHRPTIPTRPKTTTNICRCGKKIFFDEAHQLWKVKK